MKERHRYYAWGLIPIILLSLLLLTDIDLLNFLFCFLGFIWPFTLSTPSSWEKWQQRSRRYSVLGISYYIKNSMESKLQSAGRYGQIIARNLPVLLFTFVIQIVVNSRANMLFAFVGILTFEVFWYVYTFAKNRSKV